MEDVIATSVTLKLRSPTEALSLFGQNDENLKLLRTRLSATVVARGDELRLSGEEQEVEEAARTFRSLIDTIRSGGKVSLTELQHTDLDALATGPEAAEPRNEVANLPGRARPKTAGQRRYVAAIVDSPIVFGTGPAGTGKTYLAVAMAVESLTHRRVKRMILTRPAVEAGERLGFLPGDLQAKIDPYLRPLYDALYDMLPADRVEKLLELGTIEVAPLAFMRGRAQPVSARVLTPFGWREIGSLQAGDAVIGSNGRPTQVLGVYPQGMEGVFRVEMSDGAVTRASGDHLWAVRTPADKRRGKPARVLRTRDMAESLRTARQHRYELPLLSSPVRFPEREVPLDPYALGLLLGDGSLTGTTTPTVASDDPELVDALRAQLAPLGVEPFYRGGVDYALRTVGGGGRGGVIVANPLTAVLRELGLCGAKPSSTFLPDVYRLNSASIRLAVLQGLLDSDGGPSMQDGRSARIQWSSASERLADDVAFLVQSLGGVARRNVRRASGRSPGPARGRRVRHREDAHRLEIRLPAGVIPFRLHRKAERYDATGRAMRFVHAIVPAGEEECVCIRVAASDHLYVTEDMILTHNTLNDAFIILDEAQNTTPEQMKMFLTRMGFNSKVVVTGDTTQTDLPGGVRSGLSTAVSILQGIDGIDFITFSKADVVRHPLVAQIIRAYEQQG